MPEYSFTMTMTKIKSFCFWGYLKTGNVKVKIIFLCEFRVVNNLLFNFLMNTQELKNSLKQRHASSSS